MLHDIDGMELPKWYDENLMMLMVVNPSTVYAYWELSFGQYKALTGWKPLLRLYELYTNQDGNTEPQQVETISLPPFTENWYFYDLKPTGCYRAEIGWEHQGHYYTVIKSNNVTLPPAEPYGTPDIVQWRTIFGRPVLKQKIITTTGVKTRGKKVEDYFEDMPFYMGMKTTSHSRKGS